MKIQTRNFGEITVNPETVITFPRGLVGMEQCRRFQMLHEEGATAVVHYLQSLDDPGYSFSIVDPVQFGLNYAFTLNEDELRLLESVDPGNLAVLLMMYRTEDRAQAGQGIAANINGPLVFNFDKRLGLQKVLRSSRLDVTVHES